MKKPRGKQPTRPDIEKALRRRNMELKGTDRATLTIPVVYRKTFNWEKPEVTFVPINRRGFVVFRGDLDEEGYHRDLYTKVELDIEGLPQYSKKRLGKVDEPVKVELEEALLAASLSDRFVQITIPKPKSPGLYSAIKSDMEELAGKLGFEYSTDHRGIHCTFKFPKHDLKYYAMESKICVENTIRALNHFRELISGKKLSGLKNANDELLYNINRLELIMDRYHSDAQNIMWDLPNISCPGHFLWINSCERILDEALFIARETNSAVQTLKPEDIKFIGLDRNIFGYVWDRTMENCLDFCSSAVSTIDLEPDAESIEKAYLLLEGYEHHRLKAGTNQSRFIKLFSGSESYMKDSKRSQRILTASFNLMNIFQASERIIDYSTSIARNTLKIGITNKSQLN
jgi:hypothetical protein